MLLELRIKNFAIIDELDLSFSKGFNVLTGETGAGKSIILNAVQLLLGDRASEELIRSLEEEAEGLHQWESCHAWNAFGDWRGAPYHLRPA
jgi:DNA repair protein RecN (Recombination protein N)